MKINTFLLMIAPLFASEEAPFVTARVIGQMGNNFFQVATASALAWDNLAEPYFQEFNPNSVLYQHVFFRCKTKLPHNQITFQWKEPSFAHHPIHYHPDMQIVGYFQSENYFAHYRDRLLELFAPHPTDL